MVKNMTAEKALLILNDAVEATQYLELQAQASVNHAGKDIAAQVARKEDINGKGMFTEWKSKVKVSKTLTALKATITFGQTVADYEKKVKAIPALTVEAPKELAHA